MTQAKQCALLLVALAVLAGCSPTTSSHTVAAVGAGYPDPESLGAIVFRQRCSDCHVPPPPASRKAHDWPQIVGRMQNHRIMNNFAPITNNEMRQILDYLQKHAAG